MKKVFAATAKVLTGLALLIGLSVMMMTGPATTTAHAGTANPPAPSPSVPPCQYSTGHCTADRCYRNGEFFRQQANCGVYCVNGTFVCQ
jgi:hypothetical protein